MNYTFENLKHDLSIGHEIEFHISGRKFSITNTQAGWSLAEFYTDEIQIFPSHQDLLQSGTIDGVLLQDIWSVVNVETIF